MTPTRHPLHPPQLDHHVRWQTVQACQDMLVRSRFSAMRPIREDPVSKAEEIEA